MENSVNEKDELNRQYAAAAKESAGSAKTEKIKRKARKNKRRNDDDDDRTLMEDILDFIKVFAISAIVILVFVNFIAHPVTVVGHSMDPTLADGEYGFTSVITPTISGVSRGDIVVINMKEDDGQISRWVKRIIGMPGETVEAKDGIVYINGEPLDESAYLTPEYMESTLAKFKAQTGYDYGPFTSDFGPVTLKEDEYWVMGDNRVYSKDSRDEHVGPIKAENIFGSGVLVLYPFDKLGVK